MRNIDKHTPGRWLMEKTAHHIRIRSEHSLSHDHSVALVPIDKMADANLIISAPDMFKALNLALPLIEAFHEGPWLEAALVIKSAMAKAIIGAK